MKARICDRCGKVYPVSDRERREENKGYMHIVCNEDLGIGQPTYQYEKATDVDFCPECTESFLEWVHNPMGKGETSIVKKDGRFFPKSEGE